MNIGFIGTGSMGEPMARNLAKAGHRLRVYNRTRARAEALGDSGARIVETPADTCVDGVVMTMVSDDRAVEGLVFGEKGILNALPKGGVHVCLSTISTSLSRKLAEAHAAKGQSYVAAPVFGRPDMAEAARLLVVAAGPSEALDRVRPALEAIGRKLFVIGSEPAAANTLKLAGNFLIASMLEAVGEAFALLRKSGVDPASFLEIVITTLFQSPVCENYGRIMLAQRYEPAGFKLRLGLKDVRLALAAAEEVGTPMPIASLIRDNMLSAVARGMGDLDWSGLARVAAQKAGLEGKQRQGNHIDRSENMKAIRVHEFGGPEAMRLEETENPLAGPGQVLVRVKAAGVNPVDTYIRGGGYAVKPPLPYTPGFDGAGTVEAVGPGVEAFSAGDRVYIGGTLTGSYAELALCESWQVHPLPPSLSFAQGAAVNVPYATAYRSLFQLAHAQAGETVLVHGASGGVGIACLQLARAAGLTVIGTAGSDRGKKLVKEQGAHHVLDHHAAGYLDALGGLTHGRGVDVILEMLANVNLGRDLTVLAPHGRVVVIGSRGPVEVNPREVMRREASVMGVLLLAARREEIASLHAGLFAGLENGTLRPVVGKELPLADAPHAHEAVMQSGAFGKIVLVP